MRSRGGWTADRVQAGLNLVGGGTFVVGSVFFLDASLMRVGVVCFILGSSAMFAAAWLGWRARFAAPSHVTSRAEPGSSPESRHDG
jgi:hypothetical protein